MKDLTPEAIEELARQVAKSFEPEEWRAHLRLPVICCPVCQHPPSECRLERGCPYASAERGFT